jgi:hypothetical protein
MNIQGVEGSAGDDMGSPRPREKPLILTLSRREKGKKGAIDSSLTFDPTR